MSRQSDTVKSNSQVNLTDVAQRVTWLIVTVTEKNKLRTKKALAEASGISRQHIQALAKTPSPPSGDTIAGIINATGCDPGWLLTGRGEPFPTVADTPAAAAAIERGFASAVRSAAAMADAVREIAPYVGATAIRSQISVTELHSAAESLRNAGRDLLGLAGLPTEE